MPRNSSPFPDEKLDADQNGRLTLTELKDSLANEDSYPEVHVEIFYSHISHFADLDRYVRLPTWCEAADLVNANIPFQEDTGLRLPERYWECYSQFTREW